ncbi:CZB domain-containing protein [Sulfurimonas sp.]|uniref:CZB domain-containing protein n=1 Tax=Sulfurimonas sp. TaxID=2022749 RepID=UPI003D0E0A1B
MTRKEMLDAMAVARETHKRQMDKIKHIIKGELVEEPTALGKMECECGQWFYSNKDEMTKILGHQMFERLDKVHEKWHQDYSRVYEIYQAKQQRGSGIFAKVINKGKDNLEHDKLKLYYKELSELTDELMREADAAMRRITALPESKFL